jgi:hypothetical protein
MAVQNRKLKRRNPGLNEYAQDIQEADFRIAEDGSFEVDTPRMAWGHTKVS